MRTRFYGLTLAFLLTMPCMASAADLYGVDVTGVPDSVLAGFKNDSQLIRLQDTSFDGVDALRRRADVDAEALTIAMRGTGHFGAIVTVEIDESGAEPIVRLHLEPGAVYTISAYDLVIDGQSKGVELARANLGSDKNPLPIGEDALVNNVTTPEHKALSTLSQNGHPTPFSSRRILRVDHATHTIEADITIEAGPSVEFGHTQFTGLKRIKESFLRRRVAWREGETFDIRKVEATRKNMAGTGIVAATEIIYDDNSVIGIGHLMPMEIAIREAKMRSLGAGASYSTSHGIEGSVFWEHRNLFGAGEKLKITLEGGMEMQALSFAFAKPDMFNDRRFKMNNTLKIKNEDLEAYKNQSIASVNSISWKVNKNLELSGGFGLEQARITPKGLGEKNTFTMLSFPMLGWYDNVDNSLDPRKGMRVSGGVTPYYAVNKSLGFSIFDVNAAHYLSLSNSLVWANRVRFGAIMGGTLADIPADKRFYSGGSGSVRGYGYQKLGPDDANGKPTGGKALFEVGTEIRYDLTDTIGVVSFVEGGRVTQSLSDSDKLRWGGGIGARYKTVAGPIRFDVAVPFDKTKHDSAFQIYIGLGQGF